MKFERIDIFVKRGIKVALVSVAAIAVFLFVRPPRRPELEIQGASRKPLVIINGEIEQIPAADYVSSPGGISANATAAAAGDIEGTTCTIANGLTAGSATITGNLVAATESFGTMSMNSQQIHNLLDPTSAQDAATQAYVLLHGGGSGSGVSSLLCGTGTVCTPTNPLIAPGTISYDPALIPTYTGASAAGQLAMFNGTTHVLVPSSVTDTGSKIEEGRQQVSIGTATAVNLTLDDLTNGGSIGTINYTGFNGGTTQFRELQVCDGKHNTWVDINGGASNNQVVIGKNVPGGGISGTTGTVLDVSRAGQTNVAIIDSTDAVEAENLVNASGVFIGSVTASAVHIQVGGANAAQAATDLSWLFLNSAVIDGNITGGGGTARNQLLDFKDTPTVNHGTLSADSSNAQGRITGIGSFTNTTLTFGGTPYASIAHCSLQILATVGLNLGYLNVVTPSRTAPVFSCSIPNGSVTTAANCPDLEYTCWGN